ncbi:MAG: hypothetical protein ACYCW5_06290 [Thermoleophilia bacterium]
MITYPKIALVLSIAFVFPLIPATPAQTADPPHAFKLGASTVRLDDLNSFDTAVNRHADIFLWYQHINQSLADTRPAVSTYLTAIGSISSQDGSISL